MPLLNLAAKWLLALCLIGSAAATNYADKPNIILINLDDADSDVLSPSVMAARFPNLARIAAEGIRFSNLHVTTPLCGPSRACLLRAQYAHNTGIRVNDPFSPRGNGFDGGMRQYLESGYFENDLSVWMKNAGYRTMLVGKFLHAQYVPMVPPGWDDFYASNGGSYYETFRFTNRSNPAGAGEHLPPGVYRTDAETLDAVNLITKHFERNDGKPFFLFLNPFAPHQQASNAVGSMAAERYENWWLRSVMPRTADFDEVNYADKSTAIVEIPRLDANQIAGADIKFRQRLLAVRSVDDMFADIMKTLEELNLADNTYVFLTSDNGYQLGHHRMFGKANSFDRCTRVPMYVMGPGIAPGQSADHLLAHIDVGPTIVDLAGGQTPDFVDGRSFHQLLFDPQSAPERHWRDAVLIENWQSREVLGQEFNFASTSLRLYDSVYTEWANGSSEYYFVPTDPQQLNNRYPQLSASYQKYLADYLRALKAPLQEPDSTITAPFEIDELIAEPFVLKGMAEDDTAVRRMLLTLKNLDSQQYWNGSQWQSDRVRVVADLVNPEQQLTTWHYTDLPPALPSTAQRIAIWARAYDNAGNYDRTPAWNMLTIDVDRPTSSVATPLENEIVQNPVTISGTIGDDRPINQFRLVIKHIPTGTYWDGSQWTTNWSYSQPPVKNDLSWTFQKSLPAGNYYVSARVLDGFGNIQAPPTMRRFSVEPD